LSRQVVAGEDADSAAGLAAQASAIREACRRRFWSLVAVHQDIGAAGKSLEARPGLQAALSAVESDEADGLMVTKLDRLSRSLIDFAALMERSLERGWSVVALDLDVDTTTPAGEMMANVLATFANVERRLIGMRTREGLAVRKREGVRLGRPSSLPRQVVARIRDLRSEGASLRTIATVLNEEDVPRAQGGRKWHASTISAVLATEDAGQDRLDSRGTTAVSEAGTHR
jgi:DNA invertase Pin-like site-specific DNA recombinase